MRLSPYWAGRWVSAVTAERLSSVLASVDLGSSVFLCFFGRRYPKSLLFNAFHFTSMLFRRACMTSLPFLETCAFKLAIAHTRVPLEKGMHTRYLFIRRG